MVFPRNLVITVLKKCIYSDERVFNTRLFHDVGKGIDAGALIGPIMTPFVDMYEMMQQKAKIAREREESPLSSSKSIFDIIDRLKQPSTTTTPQPPLIERLLRPYIEPWKQQLDDFSKGITTSTIPTPSTASPRTTTFRPENFFELVQKRMTAVFRNKRQVISPKPDPLNSITGVDEPFLQLTNPFTPNPLMSLFTTLQHFPELPPLQINNIPNKDIFLVKPTLPETHFKLRDPFYNPLFPNRKNKLFDLLAGGEAAHKQR
ncbi:unnamed protein product [Angiostrongylus costaricensis]|uniref:Uncharacterized protein n=1 Tax=Angiostrongylus costaricensis TaxID=334426 RepID=A0A0R3PQR6_ANGCS|nr:unnamed protein product [Angiostrongylus costaricensis]